jgi:RNA polymerase sigma factor (sigma-70 family)
MNTQTEDLIKNHLTIVSRVVGREMARGVMPWVARSDLEDVAQMALVEAAAKFQDGTCPFGAFAYKTVRGAVLNELKALSVRNRGRAEMPTDVDRQPISGPELELYAILGALPPRQYRAVMLHFWGNLTQAQIADEMGIDQATVCRTLESAKKTLRACINGGSQLHTWMRETPGGAEQFAGVGQLTQVVQGVASTRPECLS